uniref:Glutaredoxin n=1 Tax=Plantago major TaxID=29818 RepID=Q1EMS4_PLAMJ|nr:glutaredoxin [Plantago major]
MEKVLQMASENGIVIFSKSTCCLSYTVQMLFQQLGTHPCIHDLDHDPEGKEVEKALMRMGCGGPVPAVFIDGNLVGSTNEVMSLHLSGTLLPMLGAHRAKLH